MTPPLEVLSDHAGAIVMGFLDRNVLYIKFTGHITGSLGSKFATLLQKSLAGTTNLCCFCDADLSGAVDLSARSAIVRAFLMNQRQLSLMTTMVCSQAIAPTVRTVADMLDGIAYVANDAEEFNSILLKAAPFAHAKLRPNTWIRVSSSERPLRRSVKMRRAKPVT